MIQTYCKKWEKMLQIKELISILKETHEHLKEKNQRAGKSS